MPSNDERSDLLVDLGDGSGILHVSWRDELAPALVFGPCSLLLSIFIFAVFVLKALVLTEVDRSDFEPCRVLYLFDYTAGTFGASSVFIFIYVAMFPLCAYGFHWKNRQDEACCCALCGLMICVPLNFIALLGGSLYVWLSVAAPQEHVLLFREFYEEDFENCSSGKVLEALRLSNVAFKAEHFAVMTSPLIFLACIYFICYLQDVIERRQEAAEA